MSSAGGDAVEAGEQREAGPEIELARVTDANGGSVQWIAAKHAGDDAEILITAVYPHPPMVAADFASRHSALEVFLAVTPQGTEVPEALTRHAPARAPQLDRAALAAANRGLLERAFADFRPGETTARAAQACENDPAFVNWVRLSYGVGYGDSSTCTHNTGFTFDNIFTYYCEPGPGNDCTIPIGNIGSCQPSADLTCSAFEGELAIQQARHQIYSNAYYTYNAYGHRYRYGAANCWGSGNMEMWHRRGGAAWSLVTVGPRSMQIRVGGVPDLPSTANVVSNVSNGNWQELVPQGGPSYLLNELVIDPLPGSPGGYACGDVQTWFQVSDITHTFCNEFDFCAFDSCNGCWE